MHMNDCLPYLELVASHRMSFLIPRVPVPGLVSTWTMMSKSPCLDNHMLINYYN